VYVDIMSGLSAEAESALESSFLENRSDRLGRKGRRPPHLIEFGDISADQIPGRKSVSIFSLTLVTTGDYSMKVSGKDKDRVL